MELAAILKIVELVEKLVEIGATAIENHAALTRAQKEALLERMGAKLDARNERVQAVPILDPTDPANLPPQP